MFYREHNRVQLDFSDETSRTKQEFKDDCNINNILKQFNVTGHLDHVNPKEPMYMEYDGPRFDEAVMIVADVKSEFESLPASLRNEFDNNPSLYCDFVADPENIPKGIELGLYKAPEAELPPGATPDEQPPETPPQRQPETPEAD